MKHYLYFVVALLVFLSMPMEGHSQSEIPLCSNISVVDSFAAPSEFDAGAVHGIAFDGQSLWAACWGNCGYIYELGFDSSGDMIVVDYIETPGTPGSNPTGITFVGKDLFAGDDRTLIISQIKTTGKKAGTVQNWFYAPGYPDEDCTGLTFARGHLYNSDFVWTQDGGAIHKIKIDGKLVETFQLPEWDCPEGLAFDGKFLWLAELCENRVYKLNVDDLTPVCYFDGPGEAPIGLTFDNRHLWLSDFGDHNFYKIDIGVGQ
jgi:sugar lactone lactonase YvrE